MRSVVSVGWVLAADLRNEEMLAAYTLARDEVLSLLQEQFPDFEWEMPFVERRVYVPVGALDPLPLLEIGAEEKILRRWDYAIVVVPNELNPRHRISTMGIPSSALEVAVVSTARLGAKDVLPERLGGLVLHMLSHLWDVKHTLTGPSQPVEDPILLQIEPFPEEVIETINHHLHLIADARLEERRPHWSRLAFYVRTFLTDPGGILLDIWRYAPWEMPIYLGRLTAAAAVSTVFLLMTAEAWEIGAHLPFSLILAGPVGATLLATLLMYYGQNMGQITREVHLREQIARTQIVLFGTLLLGMTFLWAIIFVVSLTISYVLPKDVFAAWAGLPTAHALSLERYSAFMASVGVVAGALGGNLEEEEDIKAEVLFDEEV